MININAESQRFYGVITAKVEGRSLKTLSHLQALGNVRQTTYLGVQAE